MISADRQLLLYYNIHKAFQRNHRMAMTSINYLGLYKQSSRRVTGNNFVSHGTVSILNGVYPRFLCLS